MNYENLASKILDAGGSRSKVYRLGMIAMLKLRIDDETAPIPYTAGSVEFDAYFAGMDRGRNEWRNALIEAENDRDSAIKHLADLASDRRAA